MGSPPSQFSHCKLQAAENPSVTGKARMLITLQEARQGDISEAAGSGRNTNAMIFFHQLESIASSQGAAQDPWIWKCK